MKCSRACSPEVNTFTESRKNQRDQWDKVWHCTSPAFYLEAKPAPWQRLNNKRWKNKITCIYAEQDPKAHKLSFTHPLNAKKKAKKKKRKGKENVQWKHNEKLVMAALLLMKNNTNKQIQRLQEEQHESEVFKVPAHLLRAQLQSAVKTQGRGRLSCVCVRLRESVCALSVHFMWLTFKALCSWCRHHQHARRLIIKKEIQQRKKK